MLPISKKVNMGMIDLRIFYFHAPPLGKAVESVIRAITGLQQKNRNSCFAHHIAPNGCFFGAASDLP